MSFSRNDIKDFFINASKSAYEDDDKRLMLNEKPEKEKKHEKRYKSLLNEAMTAQSKGDSAPTRWLNGWEHFSEGPQTVSLDEDEDEESEDPQNEIYWGQVGDDMRDAEGGQALADYPGPYATGEKDVPADLYYERFMRRFYKK